MVLLNIHVCFLYSCSCYVLRRCVVCFFCSALSPPLDIPIHKAACPETDVKKDNTYTFLNSARMIPENPIITNVLVVPSNK